MKLCLGIIFVCLFDLGYCYFGRKIITSNSLDSHSMTYFTKPEQHLTIPVLIHFDRALVSAMQRKFKSRTKHRLKDMSRHFLKEVERNFAHPSLNQTIHFKLQNMRFLKQNVIKMDRNGSKYLRSYCTWQGERKIWEDKWWFSVLLTGLDIYYVNEKGKKVKTSTGRGYMGGFYVKNKSCTLLEWDPVNVGYLLTHEIGHSLGMSHDGPPHNTCKASNHIMSRKYNPRNHPKSWSKCSKNDLKKFLDIWSQRLNHPKH